MRDHGSLLKSTQDKKSWILHSWGFFLYSMVNDFWAIRGEMLLLRMWWWFIVDPEWLDTCYKWSSGIIWDHLITILFTLKTRYSFIRILSISWLRIGLLWSWSILITLDYQNLKSTSIVHINKWSLCLSNQRVKDSLMTDVQWHPIPMGHCRLLSWLVGSKTTSSCLYININQTYIPLYNSLISF